MENLLALSAAEMGRRIEAGTLDPVELAQSVLAAAQAHPLSQRIFTELTEARALAEARAAQQRAKLGQRRSALDGVPVSWKDLFDTAGIQTEAGSDLLKGRVPEQDAACLETATLAGTVCMGKTHMSELAFSGLGYNPVKQTPPCVHDAGAVAGGSSSGAAASVAFGLVPLAMGSDTGGSVRLPSVWNDLVGLKTTVGRVSTRGVVPLSKRFDTIGPLARTVEDAALGLSVLEGKPAPDLRGGGLRGTRFAVLKTVALEEIEDAPRAGFLSAVERLERAGAQVVALDAEEIAEALSLAAPLYTGETYGLWKDAIEANPDVMFHQVRERFRAGANVTAPDYVAAWERLEHLRESWTARVRGFDAVLVPTSPIMPPQIDDLARDGDYFIERNLKALRNTRIGNLMGGCALTLPTGVPSTGISLMGLPLAEHRLLRLGAAAEAALA